MNDLPITVDELGSLAEKGAIAVVGALATGAFDAAREGIARLFGRLGGHRRSSAEKRLDVDEERVAEADDAERDEIRRDLMPMWRRELVKLLDESPEAARELVELLDVLDHALPEGPRAWVQQVNVTGHGTAYAAQGGIVIHHQGGAPRQAPPPVPEDDEDRATR